MMIALAAIVLSQAILAAQSSSSLLPRESFARAAKRAVLYINQQNGSEDRESDARKALDEVRIVSTSQDEIGVTKLLSQFASQVRINLATRRLIDNQLQLDRIYDRPNMHERYRLAKLDNDEMNQRESSCAEALELMLNRKLADNIPECVHVVLEKADMRTKFTEIQP